MFLAACRPGLYDPDRGSVGAFLTTLARSRSLDRLRGQGRAVQLLRTWSEATRSAPAPACTSARQRAERVRRALAELPCDDRRVVELAYYRGLSQSEIATELAAPLGTVKSWCRRALRTLKRSLADLEA